MATNKSGSGVRMAAISREFSQGSLTTTDSATDLALNGDGFFVVRGNMGGQEGNFYTRAGQFSLDQDGNLVNAEGFVVQGYLVNSAGEIDNQLTDLTIGDGMLAPQATTDVEIAMNLDSNEAVDAAFDPNNPGGTSSGPSVPMTVYDSLGNAHEVNVYFNKEADNTWGWHAIVDDGEIGGTAGTNTEVAGGRLTFTSDGELDTETDLTAWTSTFNGAAAQNITFDFGDSLTTDGVMSNSEDNFG